MSTSLQSFDEMFQSIALEVKGEQEAAETLKTKKEREKAEAKDLAKKLRTHHIAEKLTTARGTLSKLLSYEIFQKYLGPLLSGHTHHTNHGGDYVGEEPYIPKEGEIVLPFECEAKTPVTKEYTEPLIELCRVLDKHEEVTFYLFLGQKEYRDEEFQKKVNPPITLSVRKPMFKSHVPIFQWEEVTFFPENNIDNALNAFQTEQSALRYLFEHIQQPKTA